MDKIKALIIAPAFCLLGVLFSFCSADSTGPRTPQAEYTADNPGEWEHLVKTHVPVIFLVENAGGDSSARIRVPLARIESGHYIERIGIIDKNKKEIVSHAFNRGDRPHIALPLEHYVLNSEGVKIYAKCNQHDIWTVQLDDVVEAGGVYPKKSSD